MKRPGTLKHRIEIYRTTTALDGVFGSDVTKTLVATVWGGVTRSNGNRGQEYEAANWARPFMVVMRNDIDVVEDDELVFEGRTLVVASIERDYFKKRYQVLTATESYKG